MSNKTLKIICATLLVLAVFNNPYSYYQVLRWVIMIASFYLSHSYFSSNNERYGWMFIAVGILFNPILPFYFEKSTWQVIDIIATGIFVKSIGIKTLQLAGSEGVDT